MPATQVTDCSRNSYYSSQHQSCLSVQFQIFILRGHSEGPGNCQFKFSALCPQMLLEKLNGTVPCLLDTTTIPPEELSMKPSRSGADSGICEGPAAGVAKHSNGDHSTASAGHPYNRTFSPHFHALVELCLQRDPERRLAIWLFEVTEYSMW